MSPLSRIKWTRGGRARAAVGNLGAKQALILTRDAVKWAGGQSKLPHVVSSGTERKREKGRQKEKRRGWGSLPAAADCFVKVKRKRKRGSFIQQQLPNQLARKIVRNTLTILSRLETVGHCPSPPLCTCRQTNQMPALNMLLARNQKPGPLSALQD